MSELRGPDANRYYWGVVVKFIGFFRKWEPDEVHEWVKTTWMIPTTKKLTTVQFEELMNRIRVHTNLAWKMVIPLPKEDEDYLRDDFNWLESFYKYNPHLR